MKCAANEPKNHEPFSKLLARNGLCAMDVILQSLAFGLEASQCLGQALLLTDELQFLEQCLLLSDQLEPVPISFRPSRPRLVVQLSELQLYIGNSVKRDGRRDEGQHDQCTITGHVQEHPGCFRIVMQICRPGQLKLGV